VSLSITKLLIMKKFVLIYHGYETSTPELVAAWNNWFSTTRGQFR